MASVSSVLPESTTCSSETQPARLSRHASRLRSSLKVRTTAASGTRGPDFTASTALRCYRQLAESGTASARPPGDSGAGHSRTDIIAIVPESLLYAREPRLERHQYPQARPGDIVPPRRKDVHMPARRSRSNSPRPARPPRAQLVLAEPAQLIAHPGLERQREPLFRTMARSRAAGPSRATRPAAASAWRRAP